MCRSWQSIESRPKGSFPPKFTEASVFAATDEQREIDTITEAKKKERAAPPTRETNTKPSADVTTRLPRSTALAFSTKEKKGILVPTIVILQ